MHLFELIAESHARSRRKGFYENGERNIPEMLCLIHSEVSEALEDFRDGKMLTEFSGISSGTMSKPEGFPTELADIIIRVCDLAGYLDIDLEKEIKLKSNYNETRPYKHGRKI